MGIATTAINAAGLLARQVSTTLLRATDGRDVLLNTPDGWEVEQPWLWWTGTGGPWGNPIPGANGYAAWWGIPAVARCTSLISDTLCGPAVAGVARHRAAGDPGLDRGPAGACGWMGGSSTPRRWRMRGWSWMDFWTQWITSALWFGDGYVYVPQRDAYGAPKPPLWVLHPLDVDISRRPVLWSATRCWTPARSSTCAAWSRS